MNACITYSIAKAYPRRKIIIIKRVNLIIKTEIFALFLGEEEYRNFMAALKGKFRS